MVEFECTYVLITNNFMYDIFQNFNLNKVMCKTYIFQTIFLIIILRFIMLFIFFFDY